MTVDGMVRRPIPADPAPHAALVRDGRAPDHLTHARAVRLAGRRRSRRTRTARRGAARTRAASSRTSARSCCRTCARSQSRAQWWCWTTPGAERGGWGGGGWGWGWERTGAELTGLVLQPAPRRPGDARGACRRSWRPAPLPPGVRPPAALPAALPAGGMAGWLPAPCAERGCCCAAGTRRT